MNPAKMTRLAKEKRPADYCADRKCLWNTKRSGPCPKHSRNSAPVADSGSHPDVRTVLAAPDSPTESQPSAVSASGPLVRCWKCGAYRHEPDSGCVIYVRDDGNPMGVIPVYGEHMWEAAR